jgi:hypothetical protein
MPNKQSVTIKSEILDIDTVREKIHRGEFLSIAADESLLSQLPAGNWIGGTTPYFVGETGTVETKEKLFVNTLEDIQSSNSPRISIYDNSSISQIAKDAPSHGFTLVILPASSDVHLNYAKNASDFPNMFFTPIIGWVSGQLSEDNIDTVAKVGFGPGGNKLLGQQAVAMHVPLPAHQMANMSIVNLFEEGKGATVEFATTGFSAQDCLVDGVATNFAQYIEEQNIDPRFPLMANYSGIKVNVCIRNVDTAAGQVDLYAPVFKGVKYHFARAIENYDAHYETAMKKNDKQIVFSFNCIQNHLYPELIYEKTSPMLGPVAFGQIAYQLLNQTVVFMTLTEY